MDKIANLFDFQKFQQNPRLAAILGDVAKCYAAVALEDDELEMIHAAGDPASTSRALEAGQDDK